MKRSIWFVALIFATVCVSCSDEEQDFSDSLTLDELETVSEVVDNLETTAEVE